AQDCDRHEEAVLAAGPVTQISKNHTSQGTRHVREREREQRKDIRTGGVKIGKELSGNDGRQRAEQSEVVRLENRTQCAGNDDPTQARDGRERGLANGDRSRHCCVLLHSLLGTILSPAQWRARVQTCYETT